MLRYTRAFFLRLAAPLTPSRRDRDLAAELESHLQLHIDDNLRAGMTPDEARRQARLALGGVEQTKELVREKRATWAETAWREVACAFRQAQRRPWHVAAIAVMLSAGIGGSTAVFSFLYQVLLQPTGIAAPSRLVELYQTTPPSLARRGVTTSDGFPFEGLREQREQNQAFAGMGMATNEYVALVAGGREPLRLNTAFVSDGYFETLGVRLRMGRRFQRDDQMGREPVAIISDRLWERAFDRAADVLGREVRLNGHSCRIVGVAPAGFVGHRIADRVDVWVPWDSRPTFGLAPSAKGSAMARLKDDVTLAQAASLAAAIGDRYLAALPAGDRDRAGEHRVRPFAMNRTELLESLLPQPWLLLAGPLLMLLLACANVANLQLADVEMRQREFASRAAFGASRGALLRQVWIEGAVPAVPACALGVLLAYPCMSLLQRVPTVKMNMPWLDVALNPQAAAFAVALAMLSVMLLGALPAIRASRVNLSDAIKAGSGVVASPGRLKDVLMVVQVALALTLVTGGMLVTRSLDAARRQDLGLRPDGVVGVRLQFGSAGDARDRAAMIQRLLDAARALPGVRQATVASGFPLENAAMTIIGAPERPTVAGLVGEGYFATIGVKVLAGRELSAEDRAPGARVAIVNEALAKRIWPGLDPLQRMLGKHRVIGVVADHAVFAGKDVHEPMAFAHHPSAAGDAPCLLVRTDADPGALATSLRRIVRDVDPTAPILRVATLRDHLDGLHHQLQVASWLLGLCGLASLMLAATGVHSLLVYRVARQRKEIGLRVALGAARQTVVRMVLARLLRGVLVGLAGGIIGSVVMTVVGRRLFTGAAALDPWALATSVLALLGAAILASVGPSYRATRVDPATVLRES